MYSILVDDNILYHPLMVDDGCAVSSCEVTIEMDKTGSAEITVPASNPEVLNCHKMRSMITIMDDDRELFRGRILNDNRDFYNNKKLYVEGELACMIDHILSPYDASIIRTKWGSQFQNDYGRAFNGTVGDYFRYYVSVYNSQADNNRKFKVGKVTALGADVNIDAMIQAHAEVLQQNPDAPDDDNIIKNYEYPNIWDELNEKIIDKYGGHIRTRCDANVRLAGLSRSFEIANITDTGLFDGSDRRIATRGFIDISNETTIRYKIEDGYWLGVFYYSQPDEEHFVSYQHWLTGSGILEKTGNYVRVCISTVNDTAYLIDTDCSHVRIFSVKTLLGDDPATYSVANITDSGVYSGSDKRIATQGYIDIRNEDTLAYNVKPGYWLGVFYYSQPDEGHFVSYQHWLTGSGTLEKAGNYMRVCISTVDDASYLTPSDCRNVSIVKKPTRYIDWIQSYESQTTQTIEFGENLIDFSEQIDADELITCLIPLGKSPENKEDAANGRVNITTVNDQYPGELYISNNNAVTTFGRIWKTQVWDDVEDPSELLELGKAYLAQHCAAIANISINAVDLAFTGADVEKMRVGDFINVVSPPHGISSELVSCTKIVYNLLAPDKTEYTFGSIPRTISEVQSSSSRKYATKQDVSNVGRRADTASTKADAATRSSSTANQTANTAASTANTAASTANTAASTANAANTKATTLDQTVNSYSNYFKTDDVDAEAAIGEVVSGENIDEILEEAQAKVFGVNIFGAIKERLGIDPTSVQAVLDKLGLDIDIVGSDGQFNYDGLLTLVTAKLGWVSDAFNVVKDGLASHGINIDFSNIWNTRLGAISEVITPQ